MFQEIIEIKNPLYRTLYALWAIITLGGILLIPLSQFLAPAVYFLAAHNMFRSVIFFSCIAGAVLGIVVGMVFNFNIWPYGIIALWILPYTATHIVSKFFTYGGLALSYPDTKEVFRKASVGISAETIIDIAVPITVAYQYFIG